MKLYYVKQKTKRFEPLGTILANYLNLDLNILNEKDIINIVEKDDIVYFTDNTNDNSDIRLSNKCCLLGPENNIAYKWNNKSYQSNVLKKITNIPEYKTYKSIVEIIINFEELKSKYKKFIIFENVSDGGKRCHVCDKKTSPIDFFDKFNSYKGGFRVSKFIDNIHNISLHFIIADVNKFWISPIIDQQIENEVVFKGGIYPSIISKNIENKVIEETSKVAEFLSKDNYVGLCHIDFMIANGIVYFTEINPRKAGTTMCMSYMMENCFNYSIPIIEYYAVKEKTIVDVKPIKKEIPWKISHITYVENPSNNPGDERFLFKTNIAKKIIYNEYYKTHSFKIEIHEFTR